VTADSVSAGRLGTPVHQGQPSQAQARAATQIVPLAGLAAPEVETGAATEAGHDQTAPLT
jgi:hypothetical protein